METQLVLEKWPGLISTVKIGAVKAEGATRNNTVTIGGQNTLPWLFKEGAIPNKPVIAYEIWDLLSQDWQPELLSSYGKQINNPFDWAQKCVNEFKAELLCVRMQGAHPDYGRKNPQESAKFISTLLEKVNVPLVITGCGDKDADNLVIPAVSEAARGQRCIIGSALQDNYKTLVASALADGHSIIAESPIDINIAKQLNILISDMGLPLERIVMDPTIGALGYGLEYAYSIMERARLAALNGDKTLASPFICFVGQEAWRTKEAQAGIEAGIMWEALTASSLIQAGADLLVMRHPKAIEKINNFIETLYAR